MTLDKNHSETWQKLLTNDKALIDSSQDVLNGSQYVNQWGERHQDCAQELICSQDIKQSYEEDSYRLRLADRLNSVVDEQSLHQQLRYFRQREMVRIVWRDLAGWADLAEIMRDLSAMADACIRQSLDLLHQWQCAEFGTPYDNDNKEQSLIVLGMGKLGAGELNLSSDIDLIFTYPDEGETRGGRRSLSNEEFFTRLGRKLIQSLDNVTVDGFVFRVDMRLRPFGESGALAASFDAMEDYYQTQGREWERYAMIKARAITGPEIDRQSIMALLRPFVYRRYLDYGVFESLREMKAMIAAQLHRKGMENNIKLGSGGIREIEFIGQVFQLIYGGRDKLLQQRPILTILDLLAERDILSAEAVDELKMAYDFLRRTEHRIQAWADKQTHILPTDDEGKARIAHLMGIDDRQEFDTVLAKHRQRVQHHFEHTLASTELETSEEEPSTKPILFFTAEEDEKMSYLQQLGFVDVKACLVMLNDLFNTHHYRNIDSTGRERFTKLLPLLINAISKTKNADVCLIRVIPLLEAIMRRSAYVSLLVENPLALSQLVRLCAASPWISNQLALHPVLLDELLDPRSLYEVPKREEQKKALQQWLASADESDLERQMDLLREFKQIATLHVAAADITDVLPLMRVGDQLSELAEVLLEKVMQLAWRYLVKKHGRPESIQDDNLSQCGLTVLAYGKLGGLELGYRSDLDLVFIYDDSKSNGLTQGDKPVDAIVFYTRLAQRMIHLLNTITSSGILYEVDMRLRPNGNSGLLVTAVSGFSEYLNEDAWTWEHQALVRARCVAGDQQLAQKIIDIRQQILTKSRDQQALVSKVRDMRVKMRNELDKSNRQEFDLKQGVGGITDIEFLVQFAVLAWSSSLPELQVYTDNIRVLDALKVTGKLNEEQAEILADAYRYYRQLANHCVLQELPAIVQINDVAEYPSKVEAIWQHWLA